MIQRNTVAHVQSVKMGHQKHLSTKNTTTKVSKVPLVQIPRNTCNKPFQRIDTDMVGPLPRTKRERDPVCISYL